MATNVAQLVIGITSDTKGLLTGLNAAGLAIGAFAAASVKAAVDYDQAFTRIAAVSNASAEQVSRWRGEVLQLSGETAQAPQELADALFFLASAGLKANEIIPALTAAAKASAVGLGDTADIAKITANALNAYAGSGLTAVEVTDALVAAVREGSAEPEEFAQALGRILPIASQAGVSFDQVAASLAAVSNIGIDVNEGVTAMRGLLQALVAPGTQAADALAEIGISTEKLRAVIADKGLLAALALLEKRTGGNLDVMRKIVPNVRALTGALGLTVQEAAKVQAIFAAVADSSGSLDKAFATTAKSGPFQLQKALNDVRVEGLKTAEDALPEMVAVFKVLAQGAVILAHNLEGVIAGFVALKVASAAGLAAFGPAGLIALGVGGTVALFAEGQDAANRWAGSVEEAGAKADALGLTLQQVEKRGLGGGAMFEVLDHGVRVFGGTVSGANTFLDQQAGLLRDAQAKALLYAGGVSGIVGAENNVRGATASANEELQRQKTLLLQLAGGFLGVIGSANALKDAQAELTRLQEHGRQGTEKYRAATVAVLQAGIDLKNSLVGYGQELAKQGKSQDQVIGTLKRLGAQYGLQKGDIRGVINEVSDLIGKYGDIPENVTTKVKADTSKAYGPIVSLQDRLNQLTAHDYEIRVHATEVHGSPLPSVLIAQLTKKLEKLTEQDWEIVIHAVGTAAEDQLRSFRRDFADLQTRAEKLAEKMSSLGDAIKQGFSQFDLIGGAIDLLDEFNQKMAEFQQGLAEGTLAPGAVAPTAPDLGAFVAQQAQQAQQLADVLTQLSEAGLNRKLLADIASQGPAGVALGQALLNNPALIQQFNAAQQQIADALGQATDDIIRDQFGGAVDHLSDRFDKLVEHLAKFAGKLSTDDDSAVKALEKFIRVLNDLTGGSHGGGGGGGGGGGNAGSVFDPKFAPPEAPPIQILVKLDSGELVAFVDEGMGKRSRTQGRLSHTHSLKDLKF